MKTCRICNAVAFDDAALCFGCMHRFDDGDECGLRAQPDPPGVPAFYIRLEPDRQDDGTVAWSCSVALA